MNIQGLLSIPQHPRKGTARLSYDEATKRYICRCGFDLNDKVKAAGFGWSGTERIWWTLNPSFAASLVQYADDTCKAHLQEIADKKKAVADASRAKDSDFYPPCPEG